MSLTPEKIVELIKSGQGPAGLYSSGDGTAMMSHMHQDIAQRMADLQSSMTASWKGPAAMQAQAGAGPLIQASDVSSEHLQNAKDVYANQGEAFAALNSSLPDHLEPAPESNFLSDHVPFLSNRDEEIAAWNEKAEKVVHDYNNYASESNANAARWPNDYGQIVLPPGGPSFSVSPVGVGAGIGIGAEIPNVNGPGGSDSTSPSDTGGGSGGPANVPSVNGPAPGGNPNSPSGSTGPSSNSPIPSVTGPGSTGPGSTGPGPGGTGPNGPGTGNRSKPGQPPYGFLPPGTKGPNRPGTPPGGKPGDGTGAGPGDNRRSGPGGSAGQRVGPGGIGQGGTGTGGTGTGTGSGARAGGVGGTGAGAGAPGSGAAANAGLGAGKGTGVGAGMPGQAGAGGAAAGQAAAGRGGMGAMGGMGGAGGRGKGGEDGEHKRLEVLQEPDPDAIFGTDQKTTPPVIGG